MRALILVALAACAAPSDVFNCTPGNNAACVADDGTTGVCELTGNCAFPDAACGNGGFRYDTTAMPGRAGICELSMAGPSMTAPVPITGAQSVLYEITTGQPTELVFDTQVAGTSHKFMLHWFGASCPPQSPTESPSQMFACADPVSSIHVTSGAGVFCLVVTDDQPGPDHVGLRVFPNTTTAMCTP